MATPPGDLAASISLSRKVAAEGIGTFVFVLLGAGSAVGMASLSAAPGVSLLVAALANGLGLGMVITATMSISGGVLNPAAAVGLWVGRKLSTAQLLTYIVAELVGAVAAGAVLIATFPRSLGDPVAWGAPSLNQSISVWQGAGIEALLTFILVFSIYGTAVDARAPKVGGLGIGLAVLVDVFVGGNLTGAAMNPARAYGPMIAALAIPSYWYIYLIGPVVGAVAAGLVYHYLIESPGP